MTNLSPDKKQPETIFLNPTEDIDTQMKRILNKFDNETKETVELIDPNNPEHRKHMNDLRLALEGAEKAIDELQPVEEETAILRMRLKEIAGKLREINMLQEEKDKIAESLKQVTKNLGSRAEDPLNPLNKRKGLLITKMKRIDEEIKLARQSM